MNGPRSLLAIAEQHCTGSGEETDKLAGQISVIAIGRT